MPNAIYQRLYAALSNDDERELIAQHKETLIPYLNLAQQARKTGCNIEASASDATGLHLNILQEGSNSPFPTVEPLIKRYPKLSRHLDYARQNNTDIHLSLALKGDQACYELYLFHWDNTLAKLFDVPFVESHNIAWLGIDDQGTQSLYRTLNEQQIPADYHALIEDFFPTDRFVSLKQEHPVLTHCKRNKQGEWQCDKVGTQFEHIKARHLIQYTPFTQLNFSGLAETLGRIAAFNLGIDTRTQERSCYFPINHLFDF